MTLPPQSIAARLLCAWWLCACAAAESASAPGDGANAATRCPPMETRACPCAGGGTGTQICDASGTRYGACSACPQPLTMLAGSGGASGMTASAGGRSAPVAGAPAAGMGGRPATTPPSMSAGSGGSAGSAGRAGAPAGSGGAAGGGEDGRPDPLPAARGVTCGIGLPVQCDPESEKCCKRNLTTDICVPKSERCECELADCTVITVSCDGPEDCAQGQVCCAAGSGRTLSEFACAASCSSGTRQACHAKSDCASQYTCAISQQLPSISVCTDPQSLKQ